jgi:hypothetical protein
MTGGAPLLVLCRGCGRKVLLLADSSCPSCGARGEVVPATAGRQPATLVPRIDVGTRRWRYACLYLRPFSDRLRGSARIRAVGRAMRPFGRTVTLHAGEARVRLRDVQPVTRATRFLDERRRHVGVILGVSVLGFIAAGAALNLTPRAAGEILGSVSAWVLMAVFCILAWRALLLAIEGALAVYFRANGIDLVEGNPAHDRNAAPERWRASFGTLAVQSRFIVLDASRWGTGLAYELAFLRDLQLETRLILLCRDSRKAVAEFQSHARELEFAGVHVPLVRYKWWRLGAMARQLRREAARIPSPE